MGRYYVTQQFTWSQAALDTILTAFKTNPAAALFPTLKLQLGKVEGFVPAAATTLAEAQSQQADFTDYAEAAITLSAPVNLQADVQGVIATATFTITTNPPVTTNTIWNYYLYSGTLLLGGEKFDGGLNIPMANTGDFLEISIQLPLPVFVPTF